MSRFFESPRFPGRKATTRDMFLLFGQPVQKWPRDGLQPRQIQGILCWVEPARTGEQAAIAAENRAPLRSGRLPTYKPHRVLCICPDCGATVSAGRLAQHECSSTRSRADAQARLEYVRKRLEETPTNVDASATICLIGELNVAIARS